MNLYQSKCNLIHYFYHISADCLSSRLNYPLKKLPAFLALLDCLSNILLVTPYFRAALKGTLQLCKAIS